MQERPQSYTNSSSILEGLLPLNRAPSTSINLFSGNVDLSDSLVNGTFTKPLSEFSLNAAINLSSKVKISAHEKIISGIEAFEYLKKKWSCRDEQVYWWLAACFKALQTNKRDTNQEIERENVFIPGLESFFIESEIKGFVSSSNNQLLTFADIREREALKGYSYDRLSQLLINLFNKKRTILNGKKLRLLDFTSSLAFSMNIFELQETRLSNKHCIETYFFILEDIEAIEKVYFLNISTEEIIIAREVDKATASKAKKQKSLKKFTTEKIEQVKKELIKRNRKSPTKLEAATIIFSLAQEEGIIPKGLNNKEKTMKIRTIIRYL